jgi:hypothetical protein
MELAGPHVDRVIKRPTPSANLRSSCKAAWAPRFFVALVSCLFASITLSVSGIEPAPIGSSLVVLGGEHVVDPGSDETDYSPCIGGTLDRKTLKALHEAFPVAVERVRRHPQCRNLFAQFETDGLEKLAASLYYRPTPAMEIGVCRRGAVAYTFVNRPQVGLCKGFASLNSVQAASVLIHEALHHAGLTERPGDPQGLHPRQIDSMVGEACGF